MKTRTKYILSKLGGTVATRDEIKSICKKFDADVDKTINFMISYGYLMRILRGIYYVKTVEEFKYNKGSNILNLVSRGMEKLELDWYFGLNTALRLNGVIHEFFPIVFVLSNAIYRPKNIKINGEDVRFIKLKDQLFGFGVVDRDRVRFSDLEKTVLDIVYLSKYRSIPEERILSIVNEYRNRITERITEYLKFYPKSVELIIENAGLI